VIAGHPHDRADRAAHGSALHRQPDIHGQPDAVTHWHVHRLETTRRVNDHPTDPRTRGSGTELISQKLCYCETVKNITVSVPDDVYRNARVAAAQRDTSVSALVVAYLEQLSGRMDEFTRLEALQREVQAGIDQFRAADRLSRDETHDRAVR